MWQGFWFYAVYEVYADCFLECFLMFVTGCWGKSPFVFFGEMGGWGILFFSGGKLGMKALYSFVRFNVFETGKFDFPER